MMRTVLAFASLFVLTITFGVANAADDIFTDPADAGPDFALQGEYSGWGIYKGERKNFGA